MIRFRDVLLAAVPVLLAGPIAGQQVAEIREGMSQQEVVSRFGHPGSARFTGNELRLYYPNRCRDACPDDVVLLRDDRVVSATLSSPMRRIQPSLPAAAADATASTDAAVAIASDRTVDAAAPARQPGEQSGSGRNSASAGSPSDARPGDPARRRRREQADRDERAARSGPAEGAARSRETTGPRRVAVHTSFTSTVDSNLYRREEPQPEQSMVAAAVIRVQSSPSRPTLQLAYEIAQHQYRQTDDWDRISHSARGTLARRLSSSLTVEAIGEAALKRTSEDRDLGNLYVLSPRAEYRLSRANRLRLSGAYRIRELEGEETPNETNRYVQVEFRQRLDIGQWQLSYRFEENESENARRDYTRWTFGTGHTAQLGASDELDLGIRYRAQTYPGRILSIREREVPRQDHRWIASLGWTHAVPFGFSTLVEYRYENRASNDPGREYDAHLASVGLRYDW